MSDENWMTRLLSDARDLALQTSRAKLEAQQQQAERRLAELTAERELLEMRVIGLLRNLLGEPGMVALAQLLETDNLAAVEQLSASERALLERLRG